MGEQKASRVQSVVVVMTLVVAVVGGGYLVVSDRVAAVRAARQRRVLVGGLVGIHPTFDESLAIVVEYVDPDGKTVERSLAMLGVNLEGQAQLLEVGGAAPPGTTVRLHIGINHGVVRVDENGTRDVIAVLGNRFDNGESNYGYSMTPGSSGTLSLTPLYGNVAAVDFECSMGECELEVERVGDRVVVRKLGAGK